MSQNPAALVREARAQSGLSQRDLARRADTAQSVIARIELGLTSPGWGTLERILSAAGFTLSARLADMTGLDSHMLADVARIMSLTPEDRLKELHNLNRFVKAARRV